MTAFLLIFFKVYQVYAKRAPEDVHGILRSFGTDYVILEDSICYERRHGRGCRLRDLLDINNGHVRVQYCYSGACRSEHC